jgi:hypothetical protein
MLRFLTTAALALAIASTATTADARPAGLDVNKHGVVRSSTLPHCTVEDASRGPVPCTWNVGTGTDGNGVGLAYWVGRNGATHYVWATTPRNERWAWVQEDLADALAEGDAADATTRRWERCVTKREGEVVRCADGARFTA